MMSDVREQLSAFINAMWRRRWWGIAVAWLVCLGGWAIVKVQQDIDWLEEFNQPSDEAEG